MKAFETDRLQVHRVNATDPEGVQLIIFTAFSLDEMPSRPAVTATVRRHPYPDGYRKGKHYVWWVEVPPDLQRQGYATEMLDGIEEHLGRPLIVWGATAASGAFADYWNSETSTRRVADDLPLYFWKEAAKEVGGMAARCMGEAVSATWLGDGGLEVTMPRNSMSAASFIKRAEVYDTVTKVLKGICGRGRVVFVFEEDVQRKDSMR